MATDKIVNAVDMLDQKLAQVNADRCLLRLAVDGLAGMIDREYVEGLYSMADTLDNNVKACLLEREYLYRLLVEFRAEQKKPIVKKKGKARAAAKKRKTRSK